MIELRATGHVCLPNRVFVAPMAGVTDRPFRQLCKFLGAGYAVSEMSASDPRLWHTRKSRQRRDHAGEVTPIAVQIAGGDAQHLAQAAEFNIDEGAQVIDINMGCPAKKVCNKAAGSALLRDEALVAEILDAVVAVGQRRNIPITLKIRTGWDGQHRNGVRIARLAETAGIAMLTVHGRTRADLYTGCAEYDTIAEIKSQVNIPVVANGDIDSADKAQSVLQQTGADAVMIGRAALGRPWLYGLIARQLAGEPAIVPPDLAQIHAWLLQHLQAHYEFHGEASGVRTARKHIGWTLQALPIPASAAEWDSIHPINDAAQQLTAVKHFFSARIAHYNAASCAHRSDL